MTLRELMQLIDEQLPAKAAAYVKYNYINSFINNVEVEDFLLRYQYSTMGKQVMEFLIKHDKLLKKLYYK